MSCCCLIVSLLFFMYFALCYVLINCFMFLIIRFYFIFFNFFLFFIYLFIYLFLYVVLSICVFCVFVLFCILFLPMYIEVYFLFVYNSTHHCHRTEPQLQLIHIISYQKFRTELSLTFQIKKKKKFLVNWRRLKVLDIAHTADVIYSIES